MNLIDRYNILINQRYTDLIRSNKQELDNYDLSKIFEYYSCIKLTEEYRQNFYVYDDILPNFKEDNQMTRNDTGIDACNLIDTIVQSKLRSKILTWYYDHKKIIKSIDDKLYKQLSENEIVKLNLDEYLKNLIVS
jgi:hypothetical protein